MEMRKMRKKMKRRKISNPRLLPFFWLLQMYISYAPFIFFHAFLIWSFCNFHIFERAEPICHLIFIFGSAML